MRKQGSLLAWLPLLHGLLLCSAPASGEATTCLSSGLTDTSITVSGGAVSLTLPALWTTAVTVTGASRAAWSLAQLTSVSGLTVAPGAVASISCLTLVGATLSVPSSASFGQPLALQAAPPISAQAPPLQLSHVVIQTDCASVQLHQAYLCSSNMVFLNGTFEVSSPYWLYIHSWQSPTVLLTDVNITCSPPVPVAGAAAALTQCLATTASDGASMMAATQQLQLVQGPPLSQPLPVFVLLTNSVALVMADVDAYWPLGLSITANVTVAAPLWAAVVLDWGNLVNCMNVPGNPGSHLTFSGLTMINLPTSYAPPIDQRFHLFGILESSLNPILRSAANVLVVSSCTFVIAADAFSFWAYWLSLATSPTPEISLLASWTQFQALRVVRLTCGQRFAPALGSERQEAVKVEITDQDPNRLRLTDTSTYSSLWRNLTLANPTVHPITIYRTGLLDITNLNGIQTYVPPTAFFTVKSLYDMVYAVNHTIGNFWTKQFGQTILMCANISGSIPASSTNSTIFPDPTPPTLAGDASGSGGELFGGMVFNGSGARPAQPPAAVISMPATLQVGTIFTTWPSASVCWDLQQMHQLFTLTATAQLTIRGLSILNLPWSLAATNTSADPITRLVSGFWSLPQRQAVGSTSSSSFISLQNVSLYVPAAELQLLFSAASLQQPDAPPDALSLSASGRAIMTRYILSQEVACSGAGWILYSTFVTTRFAGIDVNFSSSVPPACSDFAALPVPMDYSAFTSEIASTTSSTKGVGLPGWGIGVIAGLGGAALLAVVLAGALMLRRHPTRKKDKAARLAASPLSVSSKATAGGPKHSAVLDASMGMVMIRCHEDHSSALQHESMIDNFSRSPSDAFGPNMIDSFTTSARLPSCRLDPQALISRLTHQNTALRDEQLQIFGVLGRGGHGIVYRGMWKGLPVAAKVMIVHEERHEQSKRQMLEATLSTSLSHSNIVTTYSYDLKRLQTFSTNPLSFSMPPGPPLTGGASEGSPSGSGSLDFVGATAWQLLIVQELCTGGTLRQMVDNNHLACETPCLSGDHNPRLEHVLQLALDVASGLEHLHSKNVVHSDMTPNNVLLQAVPEPRAAGLLWTAKIADFGLSVAFEEGKSHVSKVFAGTPYYIAPETQADGIISKASDIFSLGILLFEMVSGPVAGRKPQPSWQQLAPPPPATTPALLLLKQEGGGVAQGGGESANYCGTTVQSAMPGRPSPGGPHTGSTGTNSQPLLGGGGGSHGAARILPQLPTACPPLYAALIADCLNPFAVRRPTIRTVCARLREMASELVLLETPRPSATGSLADGSSGFDLCDESLIRCVGPPRRSGYAERAEPICEE